ncbi:MAG TPA: sigma-70 family RNA polymerase sigma factor [Gemmataceae bacterium]|nr:sigma-70 family RNA polymerase sigma factor [Gemmataceae bacterium]
MSLPPVMDAIRRLAGPGADEVSDADLLSRFAGSRDAAAFEALVRRYGGLVWGICRRRLRDEHAAEDAFQTTFLALARHAASVRRPGALAAWLHRVAVRCTAAFRRPTPEPMSAPPDVPAKGPDPAAAAAARDLEQLIDTEVDALPEPYRDAFVLCEVQQRTASEAARALGCAVGTIESRLTRARERLRTRLGRRGVTAGALAGLGLATVPAPASARAAAVAVATGSAPCPAAWLSLADRAARSGWGFPISGTGVVSTMAAVGLGGLIWVAAEAGGPARLPNLTPPPVAVEAPASPELPVPEPEQFRKNRFRFPLPHEAIARVGDPWLRHAATPDRMAFSGDGRILAGVGVGDRWVRVWDVAKGSHRNHLPLELGANPLALGLSEDGNTLLAVITVAGTRMTQLREYDTFRGLETRRRKLADGPAATAAFSADAQKLALAGDRALRLIDSRTATDVWRAGLPADMRVELAFAPTGRNVAVLGTGSDRVRVLDMRTGTVEAELADPGATLSSPTFSGDGSRLAAWRADRRRVRVWDLAARRVVHTIGPWSAGVVGLAFAPDGEVVAGFSGTPGPRATHVVLGPAVPPGGENQFLYDGVGGTAGRFSPDGGLLAVATHTGAVQLFDPKSRQRLTGTAGDPELPRPVAFSGDGSRLLVQGFQRWLEYPLTTDDPPRVFNPGAGPNEAWLLGAGDRAVVSPDRTMIARCTANDTTNGRKVGDYSIDLLDANSGKVRNRILLDRMARLPAFAPDGRTLYAVVDKRPRGWDLATGREVMTAERTAGDVVSRLIVAPDGRHVATAEMTFAEEKAESIRVWDAATGKQKFAASAARGRTLVAFSSDGKLFAASVRPDRRPGTTVPRPDEPVNAELVRVWDVATGSERVTFIGFGGQPAFSPDGRTLAVTQEDCVVLLELASGQPRHEFRHHGKVEPALAWRPDGRVLAAASSEAPLYLWDVVGDRTGTAAPWEFAQGEQRWSALQADDAARAFYALRQIWSNPVEAVRFLKARVTALVDARLAARACEGLEVLATADAKTLLTAWADGPSDAPLTREAKDSLRRLSVRQ